MNGKSANQNLGKRRDVDDFSVKLSTIRIWMHEKDIGKLTRILWAGQGSRLRQQASNNSKVKRFLAAVPYVMNSIKDVHQAVIDNNLETLQKLLEPPVPPALITCKDANGLNVIHKAAGLGHAAILEYLLGVWPDGAHETDITGKTALHWAASCKNNMRCYNLLTEAGCDEEVQDYKLKTASYYRHKVHEIERALLNFVPEAPRVSPDVGTDWEALSACESSDGKKLDIRIPETFTNGFPDRSQGTTHETKVEAAGENEKHEEGEKVEQDKDVVGPNEKMEIEKQHAEKEEEEAAAAEGEEKAEEGNNSQAKEDEEDEVTNTQIEEDTTNPKSDETELNESIDEDKTGPNEKDNHIQDIINSGDMEQLAQIVLNGDGNKLLNMQSPEPEIQAFLNNVPNYMGKIRRVHVAAREGDIAALQKALDRRKFAIAKDEISPNGASPLHVAVLFGHSDIVRYLAARFPETTTITDDDGRTALHYAATIKDNGHFYNVLTHLGANSKAVDKFGHTPEYLVDVKEANAILTYRQLLEFFGAGDLETALLNDQGRIENNHLENPIFKTEQGKYLANTLAEPLTKALTEIAKIRPDDPVTHLASLLQKYANNNNNSANHNNNNNNSSTSNNNNNNSNNSSPHSNAPLFSTRKTNSTASLNPSITSTNRQSIETRVIEAKKNGQLQNGQLSNARNSDTDLIEVLPVSTGGDGGTASPKLEERDEHGQSMLHFACARSHRRGGLLHIIQESKVDIAYRDELYRTARDISLQANQPANAIEIDRYLITLAANGDVAPFEHFGSAGYDHVLDVVSAEGEAIIDVAAARGHQDLVNYLQDLRPLEEQREELHEAIRENNIDRVMDLTTGSNGNWLIKAKNYYGRTALHIAILKESEEIVEHFVKLCPEALKIGDNLERTALHYAMGTNAIESISRILIQNGARRTSKDLKGRQPTYYFINKADILRLQEEEDENR